ncbi:unnamed protein product [Phaedon cochleariae]|uniref:Uncharacterized protein n=1 Tax=Phaedon cochleariae TaxID=80249 RepID=A0A9P0GVV5_PHACE|nr:unnamed protein product [Phaedon cochleariae]
MMSYKKSFYYMGIIILILVKHIVAEGVVYNPYFHFPVGSEPFMGMIITIVVPVEIETPGNVLLSVIFEANYVLPRDETKFEYPPIVGDSSSATDRRFIYDVIEKKIEEFGYAGKACLLRGICEAAKYSTKYTGVLGDLAHIFLTPSSSRKENSLEEYEEAEKLGNTRNCKNYKRKCPFSILNAFSKLGNMFETNFLAT